MQLVETIKAGNLLGECVLWDGGTQSVWWTDIEGKALYRLNWQSRSMRRFAMPERLGAFGFVAGQDLLVGAFETGFAVMDPDAGLVGAISRPPSLLAGMRLNDGRVDRAGRFWAGAMVERPDCTKDAHLYCVNAGRICSCERGLGISNGISWSPDDAWFYLADSIRHTIWRYAFDAGEGRISNPQEFVRTPEAVFPDGAAVDALGYLWSAQWGGGCVVRYAPDGRTDRILEVPAEQPSCVAFGGPNLDLLFVTSASVGLSGGSKTGAGDLFVYNVGVQGLPENRFRMEGWPKAGLSGGK